MPTNQPLNQPVNQPTKQLIQIQLKIILLIYETPNNLKIKDNKWLYNISHKIHQQNKNTLSCLWAQRLLHKQMFIRHTCY